MKNEVIFVSGQRGSGKTYWVQHFIKGLSRYLLYDSLSEYEGGCRFQDLRALALYCQMVGDGFLEGVFDPWNPTEEGVFETFCRIAKAREMHNLYVIIEEIDLFTNPTRTPQELQELIKYGRHQGINVVGVSRNPAEVSRLFTSQATRFVLFRQIEPRYVAYFRSIIGEPADMLPSLDPYFFLDIDFSRGPVIGSIAPNRLGTSGERGLTLVQTVE